MDWKSMALKITAVVLTSALALQQPVQLIAQAAQTPEYLSEVIISYGNSDDESKKWLSDNGYQVVDQNLNQGAEGGAEWMSWAGLASEKRSVYLGYKTTQNANEAITDMKIMNMNGGYSYEAYEQVLEEIKKEKEHFLNNMQKALDEYRENYKNGVTKAKVAHDNLNKFFDDDTGKYMGDLLLNTMKTEDEAAWEKDPKNHADMVTILMQGNSTVVSEIMQNLAFASDTAEDSWLDRALATQFTLKPEITAAEANLIEDDEFNSDDEEEPEEVSTDTVYSTNGFEAMLYQYEAEYGYDEETLAKRLVAEYDDDAKMFASSLVGLKNLLTNYTKSDLSKDATAEELKAYFEAEEHRFESPTLWLAGCTMFEALNNVTYNGDSLLQYLIYSDNDFLSNEAYLEGWEEQGIPQRAVLYPFVASMSEGQRALLEYTAMNRMLTIGLMDDETWASLNETLQDTKYGVIDLEPCSVYAEVDRDSFKVGNVAVTNVAQGLQASTGEAPDEGLFGSGVSYVTAGIGIGGIAIGAAGLVITIKNWSSAAPMQEVVNTVPGISGGIPGNLSYYPVYDNSFRSSVDELLKETNTALVKSKQAILEKYSHTLNTKNYADMIAKNQRFRITCTQPGPNPDITFSTGMDYNEKAQTLTLADGSVYGYDGKMTIDDAVYQDYLKFRYRVNPDLIPKNIPEVSQEAFEQAKKSLKKISDWGNELSENLDLFDYDRIFSGIPGFEKQRGVNKLRAFLYDRFNKLSEEDMADLVANLRENGYDDFADSLEEMNVAENMKTVQNYNMQKAAEAAKLEAKEQADQLKRQAEQAMNEGAGSTFWKYFGLGMAIVGFAMAIYSGYKAWDEMNEYYHTEMLPIPKMMVDRGTNAIGDSCYIYYNCVPCNRASVGMANDTLGDCGDLNGDVMKQWLALYTTKDVHAGNPIPAKFEVKVGTTDLPVGYLPLTFFGFGSAVNMVDEDYVYNNNVGGIYLYYAENTAPVLTGSPDSAASDPGTNTTTGTVTSTNSLVATGALSAVGGAAVYAGIMALFKRKKKETAA